MFKHTQKEVNDTINKYIGRDGRILRKIKFSSTSLLMGTALGLDVFLTGGGISMACIALGGALPTLMGAANSSICKSKTEMMNTAGQELLIDFWSSEALDGMEKTLAAAFNKASQPNASPEDKKNFFKLVDEVEQDLKKLFPIFEIVSGGPNRFGRDRYAFIVGERYSAPGEKQMISLTQAVEELSKPYAHGQTEPLNPEQKTALEKEVAALRKRIDAVADSVDNPKPVILDKKSPRPS